MSSPSSHHVRSDSTRRPPAGPHVVVTRPPVGRSPPHSHARCRVSAATGIAWCAGVAFGNRRLERCFRRRRRWGSRRHARPRPGRPRECNRHSHWHRGHDPGDCNRQCHRDCVRAARGRCNRHCNRYCPQVPGLSDCVCGIGSHGQSHPPLRRACRPSAVNTHLLPAPSSLAFAFGVPATCAAARQPWRLPRRCRCRQPPWYQAAAPARGFGASCP